MPVHAQPVVKSKDNFQTESSYSSDNNPAACAGFAARVAGSEEQPQEHVMEMRALKTGVFSHPEFDHHQTIQFVTDAASGLRAIIAVHDTTLGPALGGCRRWRYDTEQDALTDVLRLSAGMTLKNAAAGLDLGGGKAVILSDGADPSPDMWRAFGEAVDRLGGRYITAEDVGTGQSAVDHIAETTAHVRGTSEKGLGDPSPFTAEGVLCRHQSCRQTPVRCQQPQRPDHRGQGTGQCRRQRCRTGPSGWRKADRGRH
jgi:glutamate dehydrogenase/leucine dehydrogenase